MKSKKLFQWDTDRATSYKGAHAVFSPSKKAWVNYSLEKAIASYKNFLNVKRGTELHKLAEKLINLAIRLPDNGATLNAFVNDAIGFKMRTEELLFYSELFFGTADAISFDRNLLRIHDLKTGTTPASITQVVIYAALFCLEYDIDPLDIDISLRIYQNDEVLIYEGDDASREVKEVASKIVYLNKNLMAYMDDNGAEL